MTRLDEIKAREAKATKGPWGMEWGYGVCDAEGNIVAYDEGTLCGEPNGDFILHSREDIPWLMARVEAMQKVVEAARLSVEEKRLATEWHKNNECIGQGVPPHPSHCVGCIHESNSLSHWLATQTALAQLDAAQKEEKENV